MVKATIEMMLTNEQCFLCAAQKTPSFNSEYCECKKNCGWKCALRTTKKTRHETKQQQQTSRQILSKAENTEWKRWDHIECTLLLLHVYWVSLRMCLCVSQWWWWWWLSWFKPFTQNKKLKEKKTKTKAHGENNENKKKNNNNKRILNKSRKIDGSR